MQSGDSDEDVSSSTANGRLVIPGQHTNSTPAVTAAASIEAQALIHLGCQERKYSS